MDPTFLVVLFCFCIAALFLGLWKFYDHRDFQLFENERRKTTFICARCDHLYSKAGRPELAACPKCGHENSRLRF